MIEKQQEKAIATKKENLPATFDLEGMAGQGQEFTTARDQKLPMLKILYANSPVLDETDGKFVESARQGDIWSETSGTVWKGKEGLIVAPCLYINTFNEWKDKGEGLGRPVAIHTDPAIMSETTRSADNKDRLPNGNYIEDTGNHFVYILDKDLNPIEQALIPLKSTQKKKSKTWNSMIQSRRAQGKNGMYNPPSWSTTYKLSTTNSFLNATDHLKVLEATQGFYKSAMKSDIFGKVDFSQENQSQGNAPKEATPF